ncbi:MAG: toprim domain-containing protein, partial [bacterium]|nr:toprim domain-containing protein [bacterium]
LGAAKEGWDALTHAFAAIKAPMKLAVELGLIREKETGGHYDFFRDRLMFPIFDSKGAVVGFSGRTLNTEDAAKYINSSDSILYHKSKTLFGFFWAKEAIRKLDEVILVEGNLDCLTLRQAGIENVAAPLGTALTAEHLKFLSRHTRNFIVAFDGDKAGAMAAIRSLPLFLELQLVPKGLTLPQGSDPDNFIRTKGVTEWNALKNKSKTLFEYFVDYILQESPKGTQGVVQAWEKISPVLNKVESSVEKGIYKRQIAEKLGVEEKWLEQKKPRTEDRGPRTVDQKQNVKEYPEEERLLIAAMVLRPKTVETIRDSGVIFTDLQLKEMATQLFEAHAEEKLVSLASLQTVLNEPMAKWIREMALVEEEEMVWEKAVEDCLAKIRIKSMGARLEKLNREIAEAENLGKHSALLDLLNEKTKLMESKKRSTL